MSTLVVELAGREQETQARIDGIHGELDELDGREKRDLAASAESGESTWVVRRPIEERRVELLGELGPLEREMERLVAERLAEEQRLRDKGPVAEWAAVNLDQQLAAWKKVGRLAKSLEKLYSEELVPLAVEFDAMKGSTPRLFDDPTERSETFRQPFAPFPADVGAFLFRVGELACTPTVRQSRLASDELLDAIPDLTGSPETRLSWTEMYPNHYR